MPGSTRSEVDLTPIRDLWRQADMTPYRIAKIMGVSEARIKHLVGYPKWDSKNKKWRVQQTCDYWIAVRLTQVLGLDPVIVGV